MYVLSVLLKPYNDMCLGDLGIPILPKAKTLFTNNSDRMADKLD